MKFFSSSITKTNDELASINTALQSVLEKAGVKTAMRDGKVIQLADATPTEKFNALQAAQPSGTDLQDRAELLQSNDVISKRCEAAETNLALAQTTVGTLTREKASLETQLATAQNSITSLTADKADLTLKLEAAMNQYKGAKADAAVTNTEISRMCVAANCLEFKNLKADASDADRMAAAEGLPVTEKLTAYKGAVNAAMAKLGLNVNQLPAGGTQTGTEKQELKGRDRMKSAMKIAQ